MKNEKTLKELRMRVGLTQQELADKLGYNLSTIQKYESGMIMMNIITILNISKVLKVPESVLFYSQVEQNRVGPNLSVTNSSGHYGVQFEILGYELYNIHTKLEKYKSSKTKYNELKKLYLKKYRELMGVRRLLNKTVKKEMRYFERITKNFD